MTSAHSPLHPEALTIDDLTEGQIIVCVRYNAGQPMILMDESNYKTLRVIEITSDRRIMVESFWLPGNASELDAQQHGLVRNESRSWSTTYCTLSQENKQEIADTQRANYRHPINRGAMSHQLIPMG